MVVNQGLCGRQSGSQWPFCGRQSGTLWSPKNTIQYNTKEQHNLYPVVNSFAKDSRKHKTPHILKIIQDKANKAKTKQKQHTHTHARTHARTHTHTQSFTQSVCACVCYEVNECVFC